jgi:leucyl-tRNA synthetase
MGYGTGAIMAVPSGDQRDFDFARKYDLPITATQMPDDEWFTSRDIAISDDCSTWPQAFVGEGTYVNSTNDSLTLNGKRTIEEATLLANTWLEANTCGSSAVTYRLRDWLFSRQRYWGEPFPIVYDEDDQPIAVPISA